MKWYYYNVNRSKEIICYFEVDYLFLTQISV